MVTLPPAETNAASDLLKCFFKCSYSTTPHCPARRLGHMASMEIMIVSRSVFIRPVSTLETLADGSMPMSMIFFFACGISRLKYPDSRASPDKQKEFRVHVVTKDHSRTSAVLSEIWTDVRPRIWSTGSSSFQVAEHYLTLNWGSVEGDRSIKNYGRVEGICVNAGRRW